MHFEDDRRMAGCSVMARTRVLGRCLVLGGALGVAACGDTTAQTGGMESSGGEETSGGATSRPTTSGGEETTEAMTGGSATTGDASTGSTTVGSSEGTTSDETTTGGSTSDGTTGAAGVCGDGVVGDEEACDDGNVEDTDACTSLCVLAACGDGYVQAGLEGCDDGNMVEGDGCSSGCKLESCGDGVMQAMEGCDDGNFDDTDACTSLCALAACGDGFLYAGVEVCDDGNLDASDACTSACAPAACGDGFVYTGVEGCDDGNVDETDACISTCVLAACGDGFVQAGVEGCDDVNVDDTDACTSLCVLAACGDGFIQAGVEVCDDGNGDATDACTSECAVAVCGDGFVQAGVEACDDGNVADDACSSMCQPQKVEAIAVGDFHTCARISGDQVKCWGDNGYGQIGQVGFAARGDGPGEMGAALPAIDFGPGAVPIALSAGSIHTCVAFADKTLRCFGSNIAGQLGRGNTVDVGNQPNAIAGLPAIDLAGQVQAVTSGDYYSCALLIGGGIRCWGYNGVGQLGLSDTEDRGDQPGEMGVNLPMVDLGMFGAVVEVDAGGSHVCARSQAGGVKCWGYNGSGALGLGNQGSHGGSPGGMGDNLPVVDLGIGAQAVRLGLGDGHSCALLADGRVKCWGDNFYGQLGLGDKQARGDGPGEMGDNLPAVDLGTGRTGVDIAAGHSFTCAVLDDATVKCWGANLDGSLGLGDTQVRGDGPGEMGDALATVQLGTGRTALSIGANVVGAAQACARLDDGSLKCWGNNFSGQLGLGDKQTRGDGPGEMGDLLPTVKLWSNQW